MHSAGNVIGANLEAAMAEMCQIRTLSGNWIPGEVIAARGRDVRIMPFQRIDRLEPGAEVVGLNRVAAVPVGLSLLGRVLDGLGDPIDGKGPLFNNNWRTTHNESPPPLARNHIRQPLQTGQRVIDGFLTLGIGQRVGLFAGSGVGKSVLMGSIARVCECDVRVVVLVGERGREVRPFLEDCLGPEGLARSVVIVSTSDDPALQRIHAVLTGIAIAEEFREMGLNVLMFIDSLTRLAHAQREIGLARGEPPGQRGYPPSVIPLLASVVERLGQGEQGSITGIITVLVDGDDHDEPIADAARSLLDGHITLSRALASRGHFPAVDISRSISRLFHDVCDTDHKSAAYAIRELLACHAEMSDLIQIGAYQPGASPRVDRAIRMMPLVNQFLRQDMSEASKLPETRERLLQLARQWSNEGGDAAVKPGGAK